jgi:hypothetical protein
MLSVIETKSYLTKIIWFKWDTHDYIILEALVKRNTWYVRYKVVI